MRAPESRTASGTDAKHRGEALIRARGLTRRFGPRVALRPTDLELSAGEALIVIGPNGAGKTTLLRLLAGLARPSGGALEIGAANAPRDRRSRRSQIGLVAHETFLYPALTARENLVLAGRLFGVAAPRPRADALLEALELEPLADVLAAALSRGSAQRVAIARALMHDPPILLLDEPFAGLDVRAAERLEERLLALRTAGHALVLVSHDLPRAARLADRGLLLVRGWPVPLTEAQARNADALASRYREHVEAPA